MAGDAMDDGEATGRAGGPLVDPLLESFADRYLHAWDQRELGRSDSPLDLEPQLNDAAELFERGRQRWRTFDQLGTPRGKRCAIMRDFRDFDGAEWMASSVETAREAHRFLLTHTRFDLSKPDELYMAEVGMHVSGNPPVSVLYASVAMRCAQDAADECHRLSRRVEDYARRALGVDLAALHNSDNDAWFDRIRDVLLDLADNAAESRVYIETYLGAARTALALASAAENAANLDEAERDFLDLHWRYSADLDAVRAEAGAPAVDSVESKYFTGARHPLGKPSPEIAAVLAAKAAAKKASIDLRAERDKNLDAGRRANAERAAIDMEEACRLWFKYSGENPEWTAPMVHDRIAADIKSPFGDRKNSPSSVSRIAKFIARAKKSGLFEEIGSRSRRVDQTSDVPCGKLASLPTRPIEK